MRRTFGIDVLDCPRCGGRLRLLALIEHAHIVERLLRHVGLPTDRPEPRPARAPPRPVDVPARQLSATAEATLTPYRHPCPSSAFSSLSEVIYLLHRASIWHDPVCGHG